MADKVKNTRFSVKVFSVIVAIVLWLILTYTVNPTITQTVKNIPITFSGTDALAAKGLVLINTDNIEKVDVKIRGARSSVIKALSTIRASVDVSDIGTKGKSNRYASFDMGVTGVYAEGRNSALVAIEVDELVEKNIPVRVLQSGADKNKSIIAESVPEFDVLAVRGAKSELERVNEIVIEVDASELDEKTEKEYSYYFTNTDGEKESFTSLQNLPKRITVINNIYTRKTVSVRAELTKDTDKYQLAVKDMPITKTDIGVPLDYDKDIGEIVLKFNPDDYRKNREEYTLTADVEEGIYVRNEARNVNVRLELVQLERNDVRLDVEVRNLDNGLKAEISPSAVTLTVREPKGENNRAKLKAYVDLSGKKEGRFEQEVKLDDAEGVQLDEVAHVNVTISK